MNKTHFLKQKQAGVILIILGGLLLIFISISLYSRARSIQGFPQALPASQTAVYFEFKNSDLPNALKEKINAILNFDFEKDLRPFASEKSALAFLKNGNGALLPVFITEIQFMSGVAEFLKNYKYPNTLKNNTLFISPYAETFSILFNQTATGQKLSTDKNFIRIAKNTTGPVFVYLKPQEIQQEFVDLIVQYVPQMPFLSFPFEAIGIGAEKRENSWYGKSYALMAQDTQYSPQTEQPYRALLLPYLPQDFDLLIAGQNITGQLEKINSLVNEKNLPAVANLVEIFIKKYLPGIDFKKDLAPLLSNEFAITANNSKILFAMLLPNQMLAQNIESLRHAFAKIAGNFALEKHEITLPDGTKASELIPDAPSTKIFNENFRAVEIKGFIFGKKGGEIYDAIAQGKWFISNDLSTLKKAILLTQEPGRNLRDSKLYRQSLQPILKNPELLGVSVLPLKGVFSFSKRTFSDYMETNFMVVF